MERNMCTHDMVVKVNEEKIVFVEWFDFNGEYYVEMCSDCYAKYNLTNEKLPTLEKVEFTPCGVVGCGKNAEFSLKFAANEVEFVEKPEDWLERYCQ